MTGIADLTALGYTVDAGGTVIAIRGYGVASMVFRDQADKVFAAIADPAAHAERRFQFLEPAAATARTQLQQAGYTVTRDDPSVDVFTVTPPAGSPDMTPTAKTPTDLESLAATVHTSPC